MSEPDNRRVSSAHASAARSRRGYPANEPRTSTAAPIGVVAGIPRLQAGEDVKYISHHLDHRGCSVATTLSERRAPNDEDHRLRHVRRPLPDLADAGRVRRDEPGARLLGRLRGHQDRRGRSRAGRARVRVHHRPRQRRPARRDPAARAVPGRAGPGRGARRPRRARPAPGQRQPAALARPGLRRRAHGHRRGPQRVLGPGRPPRGQAAVAAARRDEPGGDHRPGRLPLPVRRAHPGRGAGAARARRGGPGRADRRAPPGRLPRLLDRARLARLLRRAAGRAVRGGRRRGLRPGEDQGRRGAGRRQAPLRDRP